MNKSTNETESLALKQMECTLYMPSMYSSDDDDYEEDERDDSFATVLRNSQQDGSKYSLCRCLAWSQDEQDDEMDRMDGEDGSKGVHAHERISGGQQGLVESQVKRPTRQVGDQAPPTASA